MVQGVPEKITFLEFQVLDHFGRLWTILAFLNHWDPLGQFWAIWDHFDCFDHLDYMDNSGLLQTMLGQSDVPKRSRTVLNDPRPESSEDVFFWDTLFGRSPFDI